MPLRENLVTAEVRTYDPSKYTLHNHEDGTVWQMTKTRGVDGILRGTWQRVPSLNSDIGLPDTMSRDDAYVQGLADGESHFRDCPLGPICRRVKHYHSVGDHP